jgi:hypothetical protein
MEPALQRLLFGLLVGAHCATAAAVPQPAENLARGSAYKLEPRPNYSYCTDPGDKTQLTDGLYTKGHFWTQKSTVGWTRASNASITLDLGTVQPIRGASFNTAAGAAGVEWPLGITVLVSDDGKQFFPAGELVGLDAKHGGLPHTGYAVHRFWTDELRTHGRYVQFLVAPGGPFVFADEIEIYKGEPDWVSRPFAGAAITDAGAYRTHLAIERRLRDDLRAVRTADAGHQLTAELDAIERELPQLPRVQGPDFRAILPLNGLHARMFAAQAALWRAQGCVPLTVWATNPWDPLDHLAPPPREATNTMLNVALLKHEYRAAAFNLANAGAHALEVRLRIAGLPGGENPPWITVHEVAWTDTRSGRPVAAALPEAKREGADFVIAVPAGLVRQVWLTLHPTAVAPGTHRGAVSLSSTGGQQQLPLEVNLSPLRFPATPALHVGGWDFTDTEAHYEVTPLNRAALIAHLRERFVDSPWATSAVLPAGRDTTKFDRWLERWPKARRYYVFASVGAKTGSAPAYTPAFEKTAGDWIRFWAGHAAMRGLQPQQLVIHLVDEPHEAWQDETILAWAKALRAANTGVTIFTDPTHANPATANQAMMAACDILCPNRPMFLAGNQAFRDYFARRRAAGTELAFYSCSGPARLLDPYAYHRLQAWTCWQQGAGSSSFWAFGDAGGGSSWNEYAQQRSSSYTPLFLDATGVTAGKHMEAIRESVEDFEYFVMLRDRIAAAEKAGQKTPALDRARQLLATAAGRVLDAPDAGQLSWSAPKDRSLADTVRVEILEALEAF